MRAGAKGGSARDEASNPGQPAGRDDSQAPGSALDAKNRLTRDQTSGPNAHDYHYGYDSVDNRLTSDETGTLTTSTFDAAQRLLTSLAGAATTSYGYDRNGNLTLIQPPTGAATTMAYNKENRMSLNQTGSSSASYTYAEGGMGKMRSQIVDGVASTLIWDREKYLGMKE